MKNYNITVEYDQQDRDEYGFPIFGTKTVQILAINIINAERRLEQLFGKDNFNIIDVQEEVVDSE